MFPTVAILLLVAHTTTAVTKMGAVTYWDTGVSQWNNIPSGAMAMINVGGDPSLVPSTAVAASSWVNSYKPILQKLKSRGVIVVGYVATGYFNHQSNNPGSSMTWTRIENEVAGYFRHYPALDGIFFDETSSTISDNCDALYLNEFGRLRNTARKIRSSAKVVFNSGWWDPCAINALLANDIMVVFESSLTEFSSGLSDIPTGVINIKKKGAQSWIMVHSTKNPADMRSVVQKAKAWAADWVYVTDVGGDWQHGENTWGAPPPYFLAEISAIG